ncbi:armadillo-type protein [Phlyctochytrium arcticum]|nr:armadillo-type protein [Phlyctochytrium arcticum]
MDPTVLQEVVRAIEVIYNPATPKSDRDNANNFCENLKNNPQSPIWGFHLANKQNNHPDIVRHFGLSLLENSVRFKWNDGTYSDTDREQIRNSIVDLARNGTHDIMTERPFITEKTSRLIVEVAKRMWPLQWTEMDVNLRELYDTSPTTREIVLLAYKGLAEDIFLYEDTVAELRKKELVTAMMAVTVNPVILEELHRSRGANVSFGTVSAGEERTDFEMLLRMVRANPENEGWLLRWVAGVNELHSQFRNQSNSNNVEGAKLAQRLIILTLNTLVVYLDWVILRAIADSRIPYLLFDLILSESIGVCQAASEGLLVLFLRAISPLDNKGREGCVWTPIFTDGKLENLILAWCRAHKQADSAGIDSIEQTTLLEDEGYKFLKRLAQAATAIGEQQVCFRKATSLPPNFSRYLEFCMIILDHPSMMIASTSLSFWSDLVKHEVLSTTPETLAVLPQLLQLLGSKLAALEDTTVSPVVEHYKIQDFDDEDEYTVLKGGFKHRILDIVRAVANLKPEDCFQWIAARVQVLLQDPRSGGLAHKWDADCSILERVLAAAQEARQKGSLKESLLPQMMSLASSIVEYQANERSIIKTQLQMIVSFADFLEFEPQLLLKCLHKIFSFVTFTYPGESSASTRDGTVSETTRALRQKAASALVKLGAAMPNILMSIYQDISSAVFGLIERREVFSSEEAALREFLLSIVYYADAPLESKQQLFSSIVQPTLSKLAQHTQAMENQEDYLIHVSGIHLVASQAPQLQMEKRQLEISNPSLNSELSKAREKRSEILMATSGISMLFKRTLSTKVAGNDIPALQLWTPYFSQVLQMLLTLTRSIHRLWNPTIWENFPEPMRVVLHPTPQEKALYSGIEVPKESESTTVLLSQISAISRWLGGVRDQCYHVLGRMTYANRLFYTHPSVGDYLSEALFAEAAFIENRHWKHLLGSIMQPLIINCPAGFDSTILEKMLIYFFQSMRGKLDSEWKEIVEQGLKVKESDEDNETSDVSDDIVREKVLRDVTRAYSQLIHALLAPSPNVGKKKAVEPQNATGRDAFLYPDLVRFLLWDQNISTPLLFSISQLIKYKDSQASRKAIITCTKMVPTIASHTPFHSWLGNDLLVALLENLHDPYHQDVHTDAIGLITEVYCHLRPHSMRPSQTFLGLPGMNEQSLKDFETTLAGRSSGISQRALVKEFLQSITGVRR